MLCLSAGVPIARASGLGDRGAPRSASVAAVAALEDYHSYLGALAADATASARRSEGLVSGVERGCPRRLVDLNGYSAGQLDASALGALGDEVDADLALAYLAPTRPALSTFLGRLGRVGLSASAARRTADGLIRAEGTMASLAPPRLCADATTLDADPLSEPASTAGFLRRYRSASTALSGALGAFGRLLAGDASSAARRLISTVNVEVARFAATAQTVGRTDATAILVALGISPRTQRRTPALRRHSA